MSSVTIVCPNNRHVKVKVNPATTFQQALEEACKKQGYDPLHFGLRRNNKPLDLSLSFRYAAIPNNSVLETFEREAGVPTQVQIGIQMEGGRKMGKFPTTATLLAVLQALDPALATAPAPLTHPTLTYLTQKIVGQAQLELTTLASLGISQNVLLRYSVSTVSAEEEAEMTATARDQEAKRAKLDQVFAAKKAENEAADAEVARREAAHSADLARREKEARRQAELAAVQATKSEVTQPTVNSSSSDSAGASAREAHLRSLLHAVDQSLESGEQLPFDMQRPTSPPTPTPMDEAPPLLDFKKMLNGTA